MKKETVVAQEECHHHTMVHPFKRISWTAILAGALVAVGLGFLLNLFGIAIGLSAYSASPDGAQVIAIGGLLGIIIGTIAAMVTAGYAAGYLGRLYCPQRNLGIIYGFTTWTVALILSTIVAAHFTHHVAAYTNAISQTHVTTINTQEPHTTALAVATPKPANQPQTAAVNVTVPAKHLALSAGIIFALFFIGAVSACVGACWGMCCKREE